MAPSRRWYGARKQSCSRSVDLGAAGTGIGAWVSSDPLNGTDLNPFDDTDVAAAFPELTLHEPFLGAGSFKVAYRVSTDAGEEVLKLVKEPLDDPDAVLPTRLDREIGAMKQVSSECVVPILAGPEARAIGPSLHVCYREPFYAEGTLKARIGSPLGTEFVARLAADLLRGVEALWSEGIVHRDIKPGNIALHGDRAILLDLGIAYFTDLTPVTDAFGMSPRTSLYAAPEQFELRRLAQIDFRTDLFQIGIVVYEALTGSHPFNPQDPGGYFERLAAGTISPEPLDG